MPPKKKLTNARARRFLQNLYFESMANLIDNAHLNRDIMRHAMPYEDPRPHMAGRHPTESRFVGFDDVRRSAAFSNDGRRYMHFRLRKEKRTILGKRKRK